MRRIDLDGALLDDCKEYHPYLQRELGLPDYYGRNLDALHDELTAICEPTVLVITDAGQVSPRLRVVLDDAAEDNAANLEVVYCAGGLA